MPANFRLIQQFVDRHSGDFLSFAPETDNAELRHFQRNQFGPESRQQNEVVSRWQYGARDASRLTFCRKSGAVVGTQGAMGFDIVVSGQVHSAAWAVDLRIHPDWKMKGLGVALIGNVLLGYDVVVGLGISDEAKSMFARQGWIDLGRLDSYIKPLRAAGLRSSRHRLFNMLLRTFGAPIDWALSLTDGIRRRRQTRHELKVAEIERFTAEHVEQLAQQETDDRIHVRLAEDYLNWRFFDLPSMEPYRVFGVFQKDRLRGYVAVAFGLRNGKSTAALSDLRCPPECFDALLHEVIRVARHRGTDSIFYQGVDASLRRQMKRHWFVERADGSRFMVFSRHESLNRALKEKGNWRISLADSDLEYAMLFHSGRQDDD